MWHVVKSYTKYHRRRSYGKLVTFHQRICVVPNIWALRCTYSRPLKLTWTGESNKSNRYLYMCLSPARRVEDRGQEHTEPVSNSTYSIRSSQVTHQNYSKLNMDHWPAIRGLQNEQGHQNGELLHRPESQDISRYFRGVFRVWAVTGVGLVYVSLDKVVFFDTCDPGCYCVLERSNEQVICSCGRGGCQ